MKIEYQNMGLSPFRIVVRREGEQIGQIRRYDDGYRFEPFVGDPWPMSTEVNSVKMAIEAQYNG